jgi:tight adherence protein C
MDSGMTILLIIGAVIVVGAIILVIIGISSPQDRDPLQERLAEYADRGSDVSLEEIELDQPFVERVIYPVARKFGAIALKFTPQQAISSTAIKLERAGNPGGIDPTLFFSFRIFGLLLGGIFLVLAKVAPPGNFLEGKGLMFAIPTSAFGFMIPELLLTSKIQRRQKEVRRAMPDALDLLTICVEAGLGFDAALAKVYEKWDNELARSFGRVIREIQLGKIRRDALRDMADRLGVTELTSFVAAVIQSEQLGVSMANVLRIQSDQMRVKRRQIAEEEAHKAPIKMIIPLAFLIMQSLCIVLLTPAVLIILRSGFGQ